MNVRAVVAIVAISGATVLAVTPFLALLIGVLGWSIVPFLALAAVVGLYGVVPYWWNRGRPWSQRGEPAPDPAPTAPYRST